MPIYTGDQTREISFPLGGLGTGCVGLGGNGRLRDWEIFNRPSKNSANIFTHIMVRAEREGTVLDTRVMQGDWPGGAVGGETSNIHRGNGGFGYGVGPFRGAMAGVPHFERHRFEGEYPYAKIAFEDSCFPGDVTLRAFNPFIPMNDRDSSLPAAFFEITFHNTGDAALDYTALFTLNNMQPYGTTVNRALQSDGIASILMDSDALAGDDPLFGSLCIATDAQDVSWQEYWSRALWFDSLVNFWSDLQAGGKLKNRRYEVTAGGKPPYKRDGEEPGTLAVHCKIAPGEKKSVRFVMGWHYPNCINFWNPEPGAQKPAVWKHHYASLFSDARECCRYALKNWDRLDADTTLFKEALFGTTLPPYVLDAVSANLSILKSATCLRLTDGEFYGFEGCGTDVGYCEGNCSHVWNYAYALPFLFPKLQRTMRDLDYQYNQRPDGGMSFRLMLPLGRKRYDFRPCVDGQMGGVIQVWREYLISGNLSWLREKWPAVQKAIEFAWAETNEDGWDLNRDGVMEGRQHHTLDMELFGPSSWLNGFYLAALKAGAQMAERLGDAQKAKLYLGIFEKGRAWCDVHLFNGEYYVQKVDITDKALVRRYDTTKPLEGESTLDAYWDEEKGEIRYQVANGSAADQVVAQWHANLSGLGDIFDPAQTKSALQSIYKYNFKTNARNRFNPARIFCLDGESGLRICAWPEGAPRPVIPITYAEEVFCGVEYQVAGHMLQAGLYEEGFRVVKAVRDRFDGVRRNPWNEFECGSNYVRSMASYSLIPSASGFSCDLANGYIGFDPKCPAGPEGFSSFFSVEGAWGMFTQRDTSLKVRVLYGALRLASLGLPSGLRADSARLDEAQCACRSENGRMMLEKPESLSAGQTLYVECSAV
jgi:non-lysosomal glucosylceramidase